MRIFQYTWKEYSRLDLYENLQRIGHKVVKCHIPFTTYNNDAVFMKNLEELFQKYECDIFFSWDFFPDIAKVAGKLQKHYIAWIYDMPHYTLFDESVKSEYVSVFTFDKVQYFELMKRKPSQTYYIPLAVNTPRLNKLLGTDMAHVDYKYDVSFVGSLYEKNLYKEITYLPEVVRGYIQGIIDAQKRIYGYNFTKEMIEGEILQVLEQLVRLNLDVYKDASRSQIYADLIEKEITSQERCELLEAAAGQYEVTLFSGSKCDGISGIKCGGMVEYMEEMPQVFRESKINLNITLRSITSGIPLRALDIMGAGGFLLSNYQPELAEYFVDGEEVVMFESKEDMLYKIAYYLEHEEERKRIAYNGWKKVQEHFSYEKQLRTIFTTCFGEE